MQGPLAAQRYCSFFHRRYLLTASMNAELCMRLEAASNDRLQTLRKSRVCVSLQIAKWQQSRRLEHPLFPDICPARQKLSVT